MKVHLYEFQATKRKVRCLCGWERTVKASEVATVYKRFTDHCAEATAAARK